MSQIDIDTFLALAKGKQFNELGPAILEINKQSMADMLLSFTNLPADAREQFRLAAFDWWKKLPEAKRVDIARIEYAFRVVVDNKLPPQVPGDLYETGQLKDAITFLKVPGPQKTVWATIIGGVCEDARLRKRGEESTTVMGPDTTYGQAGWEVGIKYASGGFGGLPAIVTKQCKGFMLRKVAINAHGEAGEVSVNGVDEKGLPIQSVMRAGNLDTFQGVLQFLDRVMTPDGALFFHSCLAGNGPQGTALLTALSTRLPGRKIVGFSKLGFTSVEKQRRGGDACVEPGVRDTPYPLDPTPDNIRSGAPKSEYEKYFKDGDWDDLNRLPWQSESSPHAKVSQDGLIVHGANF